MARARLLEWHGERARLETHRSEGRPPEAVLTPLPPPEGHGLSARFVRRCIDEAAAAGFSSISTTAMSTNEAAGFLEAGFEVRASLHLLVHDLDALPLNVAPPGAWLRRARWAERADVLAVDRAAFPGGWELDEWGLGSAIDATPKARFRAACDEHGHLAGYAITGRAGRRGYLQRLAVSPRAQGRGLGSALVADALRWCSRRGVRRVVVNTQHGNEAALALYRRLGFVEAATTLCVVELRLPASTSGGPGR